MAGQIDPVEKRLVKTFVLPDDFDRIAEQANAEGRTVANWLRHVALGQLPTIEGSHS